MSPDLGNTLSKKTTQWRCPNLESIADGLMKVASCYDSKGEREKSREQLSKIQNSDLFKKCLSGEKKDKLSEQYLRLK